MTIINFNYNKFKVIKSLNMNKVQFPKYRRRQISDVVNITDIEKDTLPESMRFDLMRWQNTFANRCEEQLRSVQTQEGSFIEARLISK